MDPQEAISAVEKAGIPPEAILAALDTIQPRTDRTEHTMPFPQDNAEHETEMMGKGPGELAPNEHDGMKPGKKPEAEGPMGAKAECPPDVKEFMDAMGEQDMKRAELFLRAAQELPEYEGKTPAEIGEALKSDAGALLAVVKHARASRSGYGAR